MTKLCAALIALSAVSCIAWAESDAMVWTVGLKGGFFSPSLDGEERLYGDSPYGAVEVAVRVPSGVFFRLESGYREDSGQFSTGFFANIDSESSEWRSLAVMGERFKLGDGLAMHIGIGIVSRLYTERMLRQESLSDRSFGHLFLLGPEFEIARNWSVGAEYQYITGSALLRSERDSYRVDLDGHSVQAVLRRQL